MSYKKLAVYLRKYLTMSFIDVSDYAVTNSLQGERTRNFEPNTFSLPLNFPKDNLNNYIYPETGDEIIVCKDNTRYELFNNCYGRIINPGKEIIAYDRNVSKWKIRFNLKVQDFDFSQPRKFDLEYPEFNYDGQPNNYILSNIINDIMTASNESLGGFDNNGIPISKYILYCIVILISSFNCNNLSCRQALTQLCEENGLYFKFNLICYPDNDKIVNIVRQLIIYDKNGLLPPGDSSWYFPITDSVLYSGKIINPAWYSDNTQEKYLPDSKFPFNIDDDPASVRNYTSIKAFIWDGTLTRYELDVNSQGQASFNLSDPVQDILYIARKPIDIITSTINNSYPITTNQFGIDLDYSTFLNIGNTLRINLNGIDYYREITGISSGLITLGVSLPSIPTITDYIEIVGNEILYKEDDKLTGISEGVACTIQKDGGEQKGQIRFLELSVPNQTDKIIVIAKKIEIYQDEQILPESIDKYEFKEYKLELEGVFSKSQILEIQNILQRSKPNQKFNLSTARPYSMCQEGFLLNLNITDLAQDNFIVDSIKWSMIGYDSRFDIFRVQQNIEISTSREDIQDILRRIKKQTKVFTPTSKRSRIKQPETAQLQVNFIPTKKDTNLPTATPWSILLNGESFTNIGTTLFDQSGNGNNISTTPFPFPGYSYDNILGYGVNGGQFNIQTNPTWKSQTRYTFVVVIKVISVVFNAQWLDIGTFPFASLSDFELTCDTNNSGRTYIQYRDAGGTALTADSFPFLPLPYVLNQRMAIAWTIDLLNYYTCLVYKVGNTISTGWLQNYYPGIFNTWGNIRNLGASVFMRLFQLPTWQYYRFGLLKDDNILYEPDLYDLFEQVYL